MRLLTLDDVCVGKQPRENNSCVVAEAAGSWTFKVVQVAVRLRDELGRMVGVGLARTKLMYNNVKTCGIVHVAPADTLVNDLFKDCAKLL